MFNLHEIISILGNQKDIYSLSTLREDLVIYLKRDHRRFIRLEKSFYNLSMIDQSAVDLLYHDFRFKLFLVTREMKMNARKRYILFATNKFVESISDLWPSAIWTERETYDLFGIYFYAENKAYPQDLRRILTDYFFIGYPLRKEFPVLGYKEVINSYLFGGLQSIKKFPYKI